MRPSKVDMPEQKNESETQAGIFVSAKVITTYQGPTPMDYSLVYSEKAHKSVIRNFWKLEIYSFSFPFETISGLGST